MQTKGNSPLSMENANGMDVAQLCLTYQLIELLVMFRKTAFSGGHIIFFWS